MKGSEVRIFLFGIIFLFTIFISSAELNLVISAKGLEGQADFYLETNPNADTSFDAYDLEFPPFPESLPKIYSSVDNKRLIMDSWQNTDRTMKIVYERKNTTTEELELYFTGVVGGTYKIILKDYGNDNRFENLIGSSAVKDKKTYKTKINDKKTYFELEIDYLYCGDGVCSPKEGESCETCSNDCKTGCKDAIINSTNNSTLNSYYFLSTSELEKGFSKSLELDNSYVFNFKNKTYTFTLSTIANELVIISSTTHYLELRQIDSTNVDLDNDLSNDLELKLISVEKNSAEIFIKANDISRFSEVPEEDRIIKLKGEISVFDEYYNTEKPFNTFKVIIPLALFFVGMLLFVLGIYLLIKSKRSSGGVVEYAIPLGI